MTCVEVTFSEIFCLYLFSFSKLIIHIREDICLNKMSMDEEKTRRIIKLDTRLVYSFKQKIKINE